MSLTSELTSLELSGEEVSLRPLHSSEAPALARAAAESRDHYGFTRVPNGVSDAEAYVAAALTQRDRGERIPFAIVWRDNVVGSTSYYELSAWRWPEASPLQRADVPDTVEIGHTWLCASAQRTRCNTEAKYLLLGHAFETWRVHRVSLRTDARNLRSRRAIERLGARLDGVIRADKPGSDGTVRDSAYYSIVIAEWPEVMARLKRAMTSAAGAV